jgi:hypothetical protein
MIAQVGPGQWRGYKQVDGHRRYFVSSRADVEACLSSPAPTEGEHGHVALLKHFAAIEAHLAAIKSYLGVARESP